MTYDWLWLYRRTANGSPGMNNRKRVWRLIEQIGGILDLKWIEPILVTTTDSAALNWLEAAADIQPDRGRFDRGCRRFQERSLYISTGQFSQVAFSVIQPGNVTYMTGMKFIPKSGDSTHLGYLAGDERVRNIKNLTGFHLAIGSRGIQAIQCIIKNDRVLPWVGSPENAPITKRLLLDGPLSGIKAGFDVSSFLSMIIHR
jgi:hypothetical protein